MNSRDNIYLIFSIIALAFISACSSSDDYTGREFMPDMKHPVTYEANYYVYYPLNRWGSRHEYHNYASPRKPVDGTRPRGYIGVANANSIKDQVKEQKAMQSYPMNGYVPFYYEDSPEGRVKAAEEIVENPIPITQEGLESGSRLYQIYCGICHGSGGAGDGYLVRDDGGKYPAVPANLISPAYIDTTAGLYYYSIMHGKNVMGAYADKLSYKERWDVIHFIRSLQAKERDVEYSQEANTLNNSATPYSDIATEVEEAKKELKEEGVYSRENMESGDVDSTEITEKSDIEGNRNGHNK